MNVSKIMSTDVGCCTPDDTLQDAAQMMIECDCGIIPVVKDEASMRLMGVVTDRDICCRGVAEGAQPTSPVSTCMTSAPACVSPDDSIEEVERIMTQKQVRRVPVVDENGACVGMVSQADLAISAPGHIANVVRQVSIPDRMAA
jgi:CBS domain-containing protein